MPANNDVIGAVIEQVKNSEYSPNYVKYHDGEKLIEVWKDKDSPVLPTLDYEIAMKAIKNNIPEELERMKREKRFAPFVVFIWVCIALGTIFWTLALIHLIQKA